MVGAMVEDAGRENELGNGDVMDELWEETFTNSPWKVNGAKTQMNIFQGA